MDMVHLLFLLLSNCTKCNSSPLFRGGARHKVVALRKGGGVIIGGGCYSSPFYFMLCYACINSIFS